MKNDVSKFAGLLKKPSHRQDRMGDMIREEVAHFFSQENKDPRIGFITITNVNISKDMQQAKVYYSVYGSEEEKKETQEALAENVGAVRKHLGQAIRARYTPRIEFFVDEGLDNSIRVQELLAEIENEKKHN